MCVGGGGGGGERGAWRLRNDCTHAFAGGSDLGWLSSILLLAENNLLPATFTGFSHSVTLSSSHFVLVLAPPTGNHCNKVIWR